MSEAEKSLPLRMPLLWIVLLAILVLARIGLTAYSRLEHLAWARDRETQERLLHLSQTVNEMEGKMATALLDLTALQQGQRDLRSQVQALEVSTDQRSELQALKQGQEVLGVDLAVLEASIPSARQDLATVQAEVQILKEDMSSLRQRDDPPPQLASLGVPIHKQSHRLSCEAASVAMAAAFFGVPLSEQQVLEALPRNEDPNLGFRGHVDGTTGGLKDYGVYAGPIQKVMADHGLRSTLVRGGIEGIRSAVAAGHPVIAWATYHLRNTTPVEVKMGSGAVVTLVPSEHAVVLEGYNADGVWSLDPLDGQRELLPWADFERSWALLGHMALEVEGKAY